MATEQQKKERQVHLFNTLIFGYSKGLYDLFGDSALATVDSIGESILAEMEHELGLEIQGVNAQDILTEIERLLLDEYGICKKARISIDGNEVGVTVEGCMLWKTTLALRDAGVPPYGCVPMVMASTALRKRLGQKAKFLSIEIDEAKQQCCIGLRLMQ